MDDRPSFQFYPKDWLADSGLRMCSAGARGLWMDMLCLMWVSPERGSLLKPNGSQVEAKELAKIVSLPEAKAKRLLSELEVNGVYSTTDSGTIYNRRMARDWKQHVSLAEAGRKGGKKSKPKPSGSSRGRACPSPSPSPFPSPSPRTENVREKGSDLLPDPLAYMSLDDDDKERIVAHYKRVWKKDYCPVGASLWNDIADRRSQYDGKIADPVGHVIDKSRRMFDAGNAYIGNRCDLSQLMRRDLFNQVLMAEEPRIDGHNLNPDKQVKV